MVWEMVAAKEIEPDVTSRSWVGATILRRLEYEFIKRSSRLTLKYVKA